MYPHRKKSSGVKSEKRSAQEIEQPSIKSFIQPCTNFFGKMRRRAILLQNHLIIKSFFLAELAKNNLLTFEDNFVD